ncbi:MAG: hypothetical protein NTZ49_01210 [Candidatus Parcubacteria bacterium]|nr:hypothetical protein [Candidatus Parcubacteria bacterium]
MKKILLIIGMAVAVIIWWAGLTKAGYIPNILKIKSLNSRESNIQMPLNNKKVESNKNAESNKAEFEINDLGSFAEPIIYFYPSKEQEVIVELSYGGKIIADYPRYDEKIQGWDFIAYPDGHLINKKDNKEYSYIFWEGIPSVPVNWDIKEGFIVKGEDAREFLQEILPKIGLTPKEFNEFIVYWYPRMKDNSYNLIYFADKQYTDVASLDISPKPDSILKVFMVVKPLQEKISIQPQIIKPFERKGFSVIEWGGTEIK